MFNTQQKLGKPLSPNLQRCPAYKAYFRLTPEKKVRIFFLKRHLPPEVIQRQFGKGQFEMPFSLELPLIVVHRLGLESYKINRGLYPIQEDQDFIRVDF